MNTSQVAYQKLLPLDSPLKFQSRCSFMLRETQYEMLYAKVQSKKYKMHVDCTSCEYSMSVYAMVFSFKNHYIHIMFCSCI